MGPSETLILTRKTFLEGATSLGYPCELRAMRSMFSLLDRNFDGEVSSRDFQKIREFNGDDVLKDLEALKRFVDSKLGGIDASFGKFVERERTMQGLPAVPKTASYDAFQKTCAQAGFSKMHPKADLKVLFLFLNEAAGKQSQANGFIGMGEWSALKGFNSKAITGSPARLRRILQENYGSVDSAFQKMHTSWFKRALAKGLKQTALAGLIHTVLQPSSVKPDAQKGTASSTPSSPTRSAHAGRPPLNPPSTRSSERQRSATRNNTGKAMPPQNGAPHPTFPPAPRSIPRPGSRSSAAGSSRERSTTPVSHARHRPLGLLPPARTGLPTGHPNRPGQVSAIDFRPT